MKNKVQEKITLEVVKRDAFGKKLRKLRHQGMIPANIFGPKFVSVAVSVDMKTFLKVYRIVHETGVIYVKLDSKEIPALIQNIQKHPLTNSIIHVDLRKIDLTQKIETSVPVTTVNESIAVTQKGGVLLTQAQELLIEALPADIPSSIEVDLTPLIEVGMEIKVKDIKNTAGYVIKDDEEKVVISVVAHKEESITPETAIETAEVITEKKDEEGAEGGTQEKAPEEPKESKETKE